MTATAQMLFQCNRCETHAYAPAGNTVTVGPEGWLTMVVGNNKGEFSLTASPRHLCPDCAMRFVIFMRGEDYDDGE
jgi:hypothetical protein